MKNQPKIIAFYLPQFHNVIENNKWWGEGFTEWTTVKNAKKYFKKHNQPIIPGELGYYDLSDNAIIAKQIALARKNQIDAFCLYHYWFGNSKVLLEKPAKNYLEDKSLEYPIMFCWANQSWERNWYGQKNEVLLRQEYPGEFDIKKHLEFLAPYFNDQRYLKLEEKPIFMIHEIIEVGAKNNYLELYKKNAKEITGKEIFLMAGYNSRENQLINQKEILQPFDAKIGSSFSESISSINLTLKNRILDKLNLRKKPLVYQSQMIVENILLHLKNNPQRIPMLVPNWDNTPRKLKDGFIISLMSNELLKALFLTAFDVANNNGIPFIFIKSWNEWSEGNYLEPDKEFGDQLLRNINNSITYAKNML